MTGIPVLFDFYHHELHNSGETILEAFPLFIKTWGQKDGLPMVDYSERAGNSIRHQGKHAETLDIEQFKKFLQLTLSFDYDVMLEVKDKEQSALKAIEIASAYRN